MWYKKLETKNNLRNHYLHMLSCVLMCASVALEWNSQSSDSDGIFHAQWGVGHRENKDSGGFSRL